MKIQPINDTGDDSESSAVVPAVARWRLRRLFRISAAEKAEEIEPSSVCLGKMVRNYIEESNVGTVRCGRRRCNCFNGGVSGGGGGSDGGDDSVHVSDYLKRLLISASVNERKVKADTTMVVAEKSKGCKRKDEVRKLVMEGLMAIGYDAAICKSKWDKSPSFPAGEYEYIDVIIGGERLIIDIDFRSEFEVARSTKTYKSILQTLPSIFVGKSDRLSKIICIVSEAAKQSLKKKGMYIPPWRKIDYVRAKWLSPPTRLVTTNLGVSAGPAPNPDAVLPDTSRYDEPEASFRSSQPGFDISNVKEDLFFIRSKKNLKIVSGLSSIMEDQL